MTRVKALLPVVLAVLIFGSLVATVMTPHGVVAGVLAAAARLKALGFLGWVVFVAAEFVITLVGVVPGSLLGIAAGALYGVGAGLVASAVGIVLGAICAFGLSRGALRPLIAGVLGRNARLLALDEMVTRDRWRIVALLRVSPVMPFSITSYALGLSGIAMRDYVLGTLASLPPLLGYVVIGALGGASLSVRSPDAALIHLALLGVGIAASLALTLHVSRMLARALRTA